MSRDVPTTRYFAVGFFTADQLEQKDRAMLQNAATAAAVPPLQVSIRAVHITVYKVDTGTETVEMAVSKVSMVAPSPQPGGASFQIERFDAAKFPGTSTPQDAFKQYLASPDGIALFGKATAVQLFAIDVDAVNDATDAQTV